MNEQLYFSEIGKTKSRRRYSTGNKLYIEPGKRFGKMTVLGSCGKTQDGHAVFLVKCDCGNTRKIRGNELKRGQLSCGCDNPTISRNGKTWAFNQAVHDYKRHAKSLNLPFELSNDEIEILFSGECFYCGELPSRDFLGNIRNGIDRKESSIGYVLSNCVSCCGKCNYLKRGMPYQDFISIIFRIAEKAKYHNSIGGASAQFPLAP